MSTQKLDLLSNPLNQSQSENSLFNPYFISKSFFDELLYEEDVEDAIEEILEESIYDILKHKIGLTYEDAKEYMINYFGEITYKKHGDTVWSMIAKSGYLWRFKHKDYMFVLNNISSTYEKFGINGFLNINDSKGLKNNADEYDYSDELYLDRLQRSKDINEQFSSLNFYI